MNTQTQRKNSEPRTRRRRLIALVAVTLLAIGAPATPIIGGPGAAYATQGSGGGGGP